MVKVFQRKNGKTYYFKLQVNGKQVFESTGEVNHNLAMKKATERIKELKGEGNYSEALKRLVDCLNGLPVSERDSARNECIEKINEGTIYKMKLEDVLKAYKSKPKQVTKRTVEEYESYWGKFVEWIKENHSEVKYLNEITLEIAEKYLADEWSRGIAERSYNERITKFRALFSLLSKRAGLTKNVWQLTEKMKLKTISKKPLSQKQLKNIFSVASYDMKVLFLIAIYTGLRRGDCCTLQWKDIDFEKNIISKIPSKTRSYNKKIEIPLHGVLRNFLINIQNQENESEFVLPEIAHRYLTAPEYLTKKIRKTFEKAGIITSIERNGATRKAPVYGFHSFRHSFVSLCANQNIPVHVVMELVGHNSKIVHQIYQHASKEQKIKAIDSLPVYAELPEIEG